MLPTDYMLRGADLAKALQAEGCGWLKIATPKPRRQCPGCDLDAGHFRSAKEFSDHKANCHKEAAQ